MTTYQHVELLIFLMGTMLHLFLVRLMFRKRNELSVSSALILVAIGLLAWYGGNLGEVLLSAVGGRGAPTYVAFDVVRGLGGLFAPLLLLHSLVADLQRKSNSGGRRWIHALLYVPALVALPTVWRLLTHSSERLSDTLWPGIAPFIYITVVYLAVASVVSWFTMARSKDEETRLFFKSLGLTLLGLAGVLAVGHIAGTTRPLAPDDWRRLLVHAATLAPSLVLLFFIFRHNLLELHVRNSSIRLLVGVLLVFVYFAFVRPWIAGLEYRHRLNLQPAVMLIAVAAILLLSPAKRFLQRFLFPTLLRESEHWLQTLDRLGKELALVERDVPEVSDLMELRLSEAMETDFVRVIVRDGRDGGGGTEHGAGFSAFWTAFEGTERRWINPLEGGNVELKEKVRSLGARVALPVRDGEPSQPSQPSQRVVGLLFLGRRRFNRAYGAAELDALELAAGQFSTTLKNIALLKRRVETERKLQQAEKLSALGMLSASIAHEVKNPLSSIKAITQAMKEDIPESSPLRKDLEVVGIEIERLQVVVREVLSFARPGRTELTNTKLMPLLDNVVYILGHEAKRRSVKLTVETPGGEPSAMACENGLKAVLFNVILNAVEASPAGGCVRVAVENGPPVRIEIFNPTADLARECVANIFEPLRSPGGTGIGMSIVRQRMDEMGGKVEVAAQDNMVMVTLILREHVN